MKHLTRILALCAIFTACLFVTAVHAQESVKLSGESPSVQVTSAPSVSGHAISAADLDGLTEIAVTLSVASDSPTQITVFAPFYDENGKFIGAGVASATAENGAMSVTLPIAADVSGAASLKIIVTDADFRPLTAAESYSIGADTNYSLRAEAKAVPYGGSGHAYLMTDAPTAATVLPDTPVTANVFSAAANSDVVFYVIFAPDKGSELAETPVEASESVSWGLELLPVALESSPNAVAYRVVARRDLNASGGTLSVTGAFRSVESGGNETPIL